MTNNFQTLRTWYESRDMREKVLVLILGCALIYAVFSLFLFRSLDQQKILLTSAIQESKMQIEKRETEIKALKNIPNTPLYKEWLAHHKELESLHKEYIAYLKEPATKQWSTVIKTILASHQNVTLLEIKNSPESTFKPKESASKNNLYQQQLTVVVISNYFDTINYLRHLEQALPHIRWNKLHYEVADYPLAKVEMEFSIIYEKSAS